MEPNMNVNSPEFMQSMAVLMEEALASPDGLRALAAAIAPLVTSRERLLNMAEKARSVSVPDAAERVAGLCREYLAA